MSLFSRITIVGLGAIGGSVALAIKQRGLAERVVGVDWHQPALRAALRREAVDHATMSLEEAVRGLHCPTPGPGSTSTLPPRELVVVATPVGLIPKTVHQVAEAVCSSAAGRDVLITDVGSTKATVCAECGTELSPLSGGCRFLGGHPIAGTERTGLEHAEADLFEGRLAVLTPTAANRDHDVALLVRFWQELGARVLCLDPEEHDRILARTSHLPHLLSALLAERLQSPDAPYAGPGFRSTTRLASGGPVLWRDIVSSNIDSILEALRDYESGLQHLRETIERQDWDGVRALLESAKRNRDALETFATA